MNADKHEWLRRTAFSLQLSAFSFFFTGCSLWPTPQPDPTRFFVLTRAAATSAATVNNAAPSLRLRPVELANYLRAKPVLVRRGDHELEFRDFARWSEPLEVGVARVVREELLASGAARAVRVSALRGGEGDYDAVLTVRVLACEGRADGTVVFQANWEVASTNAGAAVTARGNFHATNLSWDAKNEASLVAALSQAVAALGGEIAAALKK
ncbi:MAG: hypothetical protein RLZZ15_1616 [Verrucomicrobiota bacterium]|jgi:uncharacterized lipoprotein YmbA